MMDKVMVQAKEAALRAFRAKRNRFWFLGAVLEIVFVAKGEYVVTSDYGPIFRIFSGNSLEIYAA